VDIRDQRAGRIGTTTQAATGWLFFVAGRKVMSWIWATAAWLNAAQFEPRLTVGVPTTSPCGDTCTSTLAGVTFPVHEGGGGSMAAVLGTGRESQHTRPGLASDTVGEEQLTVEAVVVVVGRVVVAGGVVVVAGAVVVAAVVVVAGVVAVAARSVTLWFVVRPAVTEAVAP
jgi:hypothetical protein